MNNSYLLRRIILAQLEASFPASLPLKTLAEGLSLAGFDKCENLDKHLAYLEQKKLIEFQYCEICPAFVRYKITSKGIDFINGGNF